jgi:hypothetical protein
MAKVAAICCNCFLAFGRDPAKPDREIKGRCECGGLLVKPEVETEAGQHYENVAKATHNELFYDMMLGAMH